MVVVAPAARAAARASDPAGRGALRHHPVGQRRCAADVQHRQRQRFGQVVRQPGGDGAGEQDGVPGARHLLGKAVPAGQPTLQVQRRQGERDQAGHRLPHPQAERAVRPDLVHLPDQHPAGAGDRVVHLAPRGDDRDHLGPDRRAVAAVLLAQLAVAGGVQVQPAHRDPDLVRPQPRVGVEPECGLRQHPGRLQHPVQPHR
jgi:hypothetical protein